MQHHQFTTLYIPFQIQTLFFFQRKAHNTVTAQTANEQHLSFYTSLSLVPLYLQTMHLKIKHSKFLSSYYAECETAAKTPAENSIRCPLLIVTQELVFQGHQKNPVQRNMGSHCCCQVKPVCQYQQCYRREILHLEQTREKFEIFKVFIQVKSRSSAS